jgi:hypothetical protein
MLAPAVSPPENANLLPLSDDVGSKKTCPTRRSMPTRSIFSAKLPTICVGSLTPLLIPQIVRGAYRARKPCPESPGTGSVARLPMCVPAKCGVRTRVTKLGRDVAARSRTCGEDRKRDDQRFKQAHQALEVLADATVIERASTPVMEDTFRRLAALHGCARPLAFGEPSRQRLCQLLTHIDV